MIPTAANRSYTKMVVSEQTWQEIASKLSHPGWEGNVYLEADGTVTLDMTGLALVKQKSELMAGLE